MTTKAQERDALNKIRNIIANLGTDSYIATALEGCLDDAEDNIRDDAAYSMKSRWLASEKKLVDMKKLADEQERAKVEAQGKAKYLQDELDRFQELAKHYKNDANEAVNAAVAERNKAADLQEQLKQKDDEIVRLKAKLYDMIVKE